WAGREGAAMMPPARQLTRLCPRDPLHRGRRRRKFPPGNAQAKERQGLRRALESDGPFHGNGSPSTEGVRFATHIYAGPISQVQGQRGGGVGATLAAA